MLSKTLIIGSLIIVGFVIGLNVQPTTKPVVSPAISAQISSSQLVEKIDLLHSRIDQLEAQIEDEHIQNKKQLQQFQSLSNLVSQLQNLAPIVSEIEEETELESSLTFQDVSEPRVSTAERNRKILVSLGIDDDAANRIQQLAEKKEMDQLYLRNTASREGWFGSEKYFEKTRELDLKSNIYRDTLGDNKYDQFLFASQMTNRISVQSVLSESPAEVAGLQAGDFILSYANKRVFNWSDLTSLTADGEPGESIPLEIQRNNQVSQIYIIRGPLGIRLDSKRIDPDVTN